MRMFFDPDEQDEFEAARDLLVHRFGQWAADQGLEADPFTAAAALDYRHQGTVDGRLGLWEPRHIESFLLDWLPRTVTVLPGEPPADAPGTLRHLLRYLDTTGLADPRAAAPADNPAAIDAAAPRHEPAMADRTRWGPAKFWITTAAEQGVDIEDPAALQRFTERARQDDVPHDKAALEQIMQRHLMRAPATVERALPQLPVELPGDDTLRRRAGESAVVGQLRGLAEWAGAKSGGRILTSTGRLRLADARELVTLLETGGTTATPRSAADLPKLNLVFEWAKKARLVRVVKGRLHAVAKAAPLLRDPLALWDRAFESAFELRDPLIGDRGGWAPPPSMLYDVYEVVLPDVLNTLYSLPHPMPWPRLRDSVHLTYRAAFQLSGPEAVRNGWYEQADRDLRTVLSALEDLGCVERTRGMADPVFLDVPLDDVPPEGPDAQPGPGLPAGLPPELAALFGASPSAPDAEDSAERARARRAELTDGPVELIRLTGLGTRAVRRRLLAEGREAPLVGELADATATGLLGVLADHYDPGSARTEATAWITAHGGPTAALEQLTDAVRAMPFRSRAEAMLNVLVTALPDGEGERLLRTLRTDPQLAPTALNVLLNHGLLAPEDLTEPEGLLVLAEGLLQLLDTAGPESAAEILQAEGPDAREAVAAALESGHPDHAGLAELRAFAESLRPAKPRLHTRHVRQGHRSARGGKKGNRNRNRRHRG